MSTLRNRVEQLDKQVEAFIERAEEVVLNQEVYTDGWNAREIVAHIAGWHKYYSDVVTAIAADKEPPLYKVGTGTRNMELADNYGKWTRAKLINLLKSSHSKLRKNIFRVKGNQIPYKHNGRIYTKIAYIEEITRHMLKHAKDLKKAVKN